MGVARSAGEKANEFAAITTQKAACVDRAAASLGGAGADVAGRERRDGRKGE